MSAASGLGAAVGNGLGVVADDVDGDGRVDLFVANDGTPNHLWMNQGRGRFVDAALTRGVAIDRTGRRKRAWAFMSPISTATATTTCW